MNGRDESQPGDVRLLRQDQLAEGLAGLGPQRLAEITHLPTGIASGQVASMHVPAGGMTAARSAAGDETLLYVVAGHVLVRWGPTLAMATPAGPGDTILLPAGTPFRADNASASAPLQYILVGGG